MSPTTPAKVGRRPDPGKRNRILEALTGDPSWFPEIGTPPYNVALVADRLGMDPSNVRKALLQLEAEGLVVREKRKMPIWNGIAHDHVDRSCLCFWNAATMAMDRAAAQEWEDGADGRSEAAFAQMVG